MLRIVKSCIGTKLIKHRHDAILSINSHHIALYPGEFGAIAVNAKRTAIRVGLIVIFTTPQ